MDEQTIYARRWWTLGVLCLSLTVISIDNTILNVALPHIVEDIGATGSQLQWIIDSYTLVFACLLLTSGSLGDKLGRKGILTIGLFIFGTCSAIAAFSGTPATLIAARGIMGIGGAAIFPTTLSILTNTFQGPERAKAIGIWAGVSGLGVAIGPLGGGLLLEHFWWGSVFLINVPVCAAAIVLGHFFVPPSRDLHDTKLDPVGAVLSILGLVGLLFGIIEGPDRGWSSPMVLTGFAMAIVFLGGFAWWESHTDDPMLDVRFFKNPRFSAASATITLNYFALFGSTFLLTEYFQFVLQYSPLKAGAMTAPVAIGLMAAAPNAAKAVTRFGTKNVVVFGLMFVTGALLLYASDSIMSSSWVGGVVRLMFGVGMGFVAAPATESIMGSLPKEKAGVGSAVNDTTRQTGGALGVAVLGSLFAARYRSVIEVPAGLTAAQDADVRDSIGRAVNVAGQVPSRATEIHDAAADAFKDAMHLAYPVAAAFVVLAAILAWRYLPARAEAVDEPAADLDLDLASP
jgi:EmrB/QacA subfamily drug resistance transporter